MFLKDHHQYWNRYKHLTGISDSSAYPVFTVMSLVAELLKTVFFFHPSFIFLTNVAVTLFKYLLVSFFILPFFSPWLWSKVMHCLTPVKTWRLQLNKMRKCKWDVGTPCLMHVESPSLLLLSLKKGSAQVPAGGKDIGVFEDVLFSLWSLGFCVYLRNQYAVWLVDIFHIHGCGNVYIMSYVIHTGIADFWQLGCHCKNVHFT